MNIYLRVLDNKILSINTEKIDKSLVKLNVKDIDDFYRQTKNYELDYEIEESVSDLLSRNEEENYLSTFDIRHWVSNRSFGELIDMYDNNEIIKPPMQRQFVWDSLKCSRLIESIILGLPIPPLFLLEISKNKYELIDGFQRLTTIYNYVMGNPWHENKNSNRKISAKLSSKISKELQNKSFDQLESEHQRTILRNTIPLIEFKQLDPDDLTSKYLIFERINTGSEKLNQMQIRKSLSYGKFMKDLYKTSKSNEKFMTLFSKSSIKKDMHVEAFLRVIVMSEVYYNEYRPKSGINNILNAYCERDKDEIIDDYYVEDFNRVIDRIFNIFPDKQNMFRRVESNSGKPETTGNLNISILDAFVGVFIRNINEISLTDKKIYENYIKYMYQIMDESINDIKKDNPFTTSTGSFDSIAKRYAICEKIFGLNNDNI